MKQEEKVYNLPLKKEELFIIGAALGATAKVLSAEANSASDMVEAIAVTLLCAKVTDFIERNTKADNGD